VSAVLTAWGSWQPALDPHRRPSVSEALVGSLGGRRADQQVPSPVGVTPATPCQLTLRQRCPTLPAAGSAQTQPTSAQTWTVCQSPEEMAAGVCSGCGGHHAVASSVYRCCWTLAPGRACSAWQRRRGGTASSPWRPAPAGRVLEVEISHPPPADPAFSADGATAERHAPMQPADCASLSITMLRSCCRGRSLPCG
jgi:hypothetical protein